MDLPVDVTSWAVEDVGRWLRSVGFEKLHELICKEHEIDGKALLALTEDVRCINLCTVYILLILGYERGYIFPYHTIHTIPKTALFTQRIDKTLHPLQPGA